MPQKCGCSRCLSNGWSWHCVHCVWMPRKSRVVRDVIGTKSKSPSSCWRFCGMGRPTWARMKVTAADSAWVSHLVCQSATWHELLVVPRSDVLAEEGSVGAAGHRQGDGQLKAVSRLATTAKPAALVSTRLQYEPFPDAWAIVWPPIG